jgi:hypothetical protein
LHTFAALPQDRRQANASKLHHSTGAVAQREHERRAQFHLKNPSMALGGKTFRQGRFTSWPAMNSTARDVGSLGSILSEGHQITGDHAYESAYHLSRDKVQQRKTLKNAKNCLTLSRKRKKRSCREDNENPLITILINPFLIVKNLYYVFSIIVCVVIAHCVLIVCSVYTNISGFFYDIWQFSVNVPISFYTPVRFAAGFI